MLKIFKIKLQFPSVGKKKKKKKVFTNKSSTPERGIPTLGLDVRETAKS